MDHIRVSFFPPEPLQIAWSPIESLQHTMLAHVTGQVPDQGRENGKAYQDPAFETFEKLPVVTTTPVYHSESDRQQQQPETPCCQSNDLSAATIRQVRSATCESFFTLISIRGIRGAIVRQDQGRLFTGTCKPVALHFGRSAELHLPIHRGRQCDNISQG